MEYEVLEMEIIRFDSEDVITASGGGSSCPVQTTPICVAN